MRVRLAIFCVRGGTHPENPIALKHTFFQAILLICQRARAQNGPPTGRPRIFRHPPRGAKRAPKTACAGPSGPKSAPRASSRAPGDHRAAPRGPPALPQGPSGPPRGLLMELPMTPTCHMSPRGPPRAPRTPPRACNGSGHVFPTQVGPCLPGSGHVCPGQAILARYGPGHFCPSRVRPFLP